VVATLAGHRSPAVLMRSHGVFTDQVDALHARYQNHYGQ
jgi:hypothetical protein